jgi:hypothetical protein
MSQHDDVIAVVWHDKRNDTIFSTNSDLKCDKAEEKKVRRCKEKIEKPCPTAVASYVCSMKAVDLSDLLHEYYGSVHFLKAVEVHFSSCTKSIL